MIRAWLGGPDHPRRELVRVAAVSNASDFTEGSALVVLDTDQLRVVPMKLLYLYQQPEVGERPVELMWAP